MALTATKGRSEVVDGVLLVPPSALPDHQWISGAIHMSLGGFVRGNGLGVVIAAPSDLLIQRQPLRVRQPDVMYFSAQRTGFRGRHEMRGLLIFEVPPDLAVEVLSPSNTRRAFQDKLHDYRQIGVLECWLVDAEAETVQVLDLSAASPDVTYSRGETLESKVLPGFALPWDEIFG